MYHHYRNTTTLGRALQETLVQLIRESKITFKQAERVMAEFDSSIACSFDIAPENLFQISAEKCEGYASVDNGKVFALKNVDLILEDKIFAQVDKLQLIVCDKSSGPSPFPSPCSSPSGSPSEIKSPNDGKILSDNENPSDSESTCSSLYAYKLLGSGSSDEHSDVPED